jgi:hypothetical protein
MPRPVRPVVTQTDLQVYLGSQDDFALEMFVYSEAVKAELDTTHGGTYQDRSTGKFRQYDVRATRTRNSHQIGLAIECKAIRNTFPLLVSRIRRAEPESAHSTIHSYRPSQPTPGLGVDWAPAQSATVAPSLIYPANELVGKSTVQVGRNPNDGELVSSDAEVYEKWTQALASAAALVDDAWLGFERSTTRTLDSIVLPALVVPDATLWAADYKDDGTQVSTPHQIDQTTLYMGREYRGPASLKYLVTHLHILTKSQVRPFLDRVSSDNSFWKALFPKVAW